MNAGTTLVIGGTGKTGRRVAERLARRGHPVRIGSRTAQPPFDWLREASWPEALDGVESAYVTYQPDLAVPGSVDAMRTLTRLARERGIKHMVLLSGRGETEAERCEEIVRDSSAVDDLAVQLVRAKFQRELLPGWRARGPSHAADERRRRAVC